MFDKNTMTAMLIKVRAWIQNPGERQLTVSPAITNKDERIAYDRGFHSADTGHGNWYTPGSILHRRFEEGARDADAIEVISW